MPLMFIKQRWMRSRWNWPPILLDQLHASGITVLVHSKGLLSEEAPTAYKDAQLVVNVVQNADLARLVARLKPLIVVKG